MTDWEGKPHSLESKTIVAAHANLHPQVLELIRESLV